MKLVEFTGDMAVRHPVREMDSPFSGKIFDVVRETFEFGEETLTREFTDHLGAVGVLALDDQDRVLLVKQYRHPVRMELWELPAGLLDNFQEPPSEAAARELHEEADLQAQTWDKLLHWFASPGCSTEEFTVYLARNLSPVPEEERYERTEEEAGIVGSWVPLNFARDMVFNGQLHNPMAVTAILALSSMKDRGELY